MAIYRLDRFFKDKELSGTMVFSILFSAFVFLFLAALIFFLFIEGFPALKREGLQFFTEANWFFRISEYKAASMIYGTFMVSLIAIFIAAPIGFGASVFISEYLSGSPRFFAKSIIELLAGIPSVVYGLLGILFLQPFLYKNFDLNSGDTLLTAGVLLSIMILPTIITLSDDAFRSVSSEERETSLSLGLTKEETFFSTVFPKALPGFIVAILLATGRALGETIAVFLVVGRADNRLPNSLFDLDPVFKAGQTLTSKLGGSEIFIAYGNPEHWSSIVALGLFLFVFVMGCVLIGDLILIYRDKSRI